MVTMTYVLLVDPQFGNYLQQYFFNKGYSRPFTDVANTIRDNTSILYVDTKKLQIWCYNSLSHTSVIGRVTYTIDLRSVRIIH